VRQIVANLDEKLQILADEDISHDEVQVDVLDMASVIDCYVERCKRIGKSLRCVYSVSLIHTSAKSHAIESVKAGKFASKWEISYEAGTWNQAQCSNVTTGQLAIAIKTAVMSRSKNNSS
jgi:hypothetical protein